MNFRKSGLCALLIMLVECSQAYSASLKPVGSLDLPGAPGKRFDYLTFDEKDHLLFSAHLGAGLMYVIDVRTNTLVNTISDVPGIEGIEYVPELDKVYTSNWGDHTIGVVDLKEMRLVKKIPAEIKPDGSAYAPSFKKLYVSDERAKALIVVDVLTDEIVKTLRFDSETGMPQFDPVANRIYLNLQDQNLFAVINPVDDTIEGTIPVGACQGNHGMALDPENHRAFLACEGNNLMTVLDLDAKTPIANLPMAQGADVVKFDRDLGRIYVACYSGAISIFHEDDPNHFTKVEDFPVQPKVHSLAMDPETHRVYAPEQEEDGNPVSRMMIFDAVP